MIFLWNTDDCMPYIRREGHTWGCQVEYGGSLQEGREPDLGLPVVLDLYVLRRLSLGSLPMTSSILVPPGLNCSIELSNTSNHARCSLSAVVGV